MCVQSSGLVVGQQVTQNIQSELVAILTLDNSPVLGLTGADVIVQFRKEGQNSFTVKSASDTAGSVTSGNQELYTFTDGQTLTVAVDGGGAQIATFNTADFVDISNATSAEVATVINTDVTGVSASDVGGFVVITSVTTGSTSSIQVTGGTGNSALGFPTNLNSGVNVFNEIGNGVYTIDFFPNELDTLGSFTFVVTGSGFDQSTNIVTIVSATQDIVIVTTQTCTITGHVFDLFGSPITGAGVSARVIGLPSIEQNQIAVSDDLISVKTNTDGQFFISLIRLADVELFIPIVNYRRQFVVPNQSSANIFTDIA